MATLFDGLQYLAGIVSIVCFILVIIAMFKAGQTGLAIACLVLLLCGAIGFIFAFVVGWMRSSEWQLRRIMIIWTVALVIGFISGGAGFALR